MPEANGGPASTPGETTVQAATVPAITDPVPLSPFEKRMYNLFIASGSLRPIWRLLLYLLLYETLHFLLGTLLYFAAVPAIWWRMLVELGFVVAALAPAFVMAPFEGRRFDSYGLPRQRVFRKQFWLGGLWGLLSITVLLVSLHFAGAFDFGGLALHGVLRPLKFAVFWGAFFLAVGVYEEFFSRGYTQFTLTQIAGFWPAAILLSLAFGALHLGNPGESGAGIAGAVCIGFFFCLTLRRTGNLWFAVGFHASWDWAQSFLYSVPDSGGMFPGHLMKASLHGPRWLSGGSVGPEASAFLFVLIVLLWLLFDRIYPDVKYPEVETNDLQQPLTPSS
jgi:uncharacterized protein